ncbi:putative colanic acid biosynthesis acetyltransferase [Parerythrobacter aurantius]|uniref:putative colanic acid biosynthesis acetyltransferase n=1 Tax=Parerythrobacter aurantius TaxID=3127706 RepID=UPI0032507DF8
MSEPLDARTHDPVHGGPSFSLANRIERALFAVVWLLLARILPPPFGWAWRRTLLRLFGASLAPHARIYPSARIWLPRNLTMDAWSTLGPGVQCYNQAPVAIGTGAVVSQRAFLCTGDHDYRHPAHQLVTRPIAIGAKAWIAAEAFVGPGVTVGEAAVLGARGCATRDLPAGTVWAGNPAQQVSTRDSAA